MSIVKLNNKKLTNMISTNLFVQIKLLLLLNLCLAQKMRGFHHYKNSM